MYRIVSPSRTNKLPSPTHFPYGRGVSERRWRSAANRPSRQARRGWASLYEAPSQKKNHLPRATKIQQPKNFTPAPTSPPAPPPHKKSLPTLLRANHGSTPGFFGPIWVGFGLFWVKVGLFRVDSGLSRVKTAPFWAPLPLPSTPPPPRGMCKNFISQPARTNTTLPLRFPKFTQNNT